jgi:hypothetical protein
MFMAGVSLLVKSVIGKSSWTFISGSDPNGSCWRSQATRMNKKHNAILAVKPTRVEQEISRIKTKAVA